jgi:3-keto-disaccharide hydrolase
MNRTAAFALSFATLGCSEMPSLPSWVPGSGWTTLIDGESGLDNFERVGDANWRPEGGAIVADKGKGGFLLSKQSYKDFELKIEFWADHTADSGIYMRCSEPKNLTDKTCYEANIFDQRRDQTYATGGIVHRGKVLKPIKAGGQWNVYEITVKGSKMTVVLNGTKTAEIDNVESASGPIALQFGNQPKAVRGAIKWRKVQIKPL